jgi:hypothetical protein
MFTIATLQIPRTLSPKFNVQSFDLVSFRRLPPQLPTWPTHPLTSSSVMSIGIKSFPDRIAGESTQDLIDIDESGYRLNSHNCSFGKVTREKRCNVCGKYKNEAEE